MADDDVDTTTPLDGDGQGVVFPDESGEDLHAQFDNVVPEEYETRGQTILATPRGYAFAHSTKEVPVITHAGVMVNAENAEKILEESIRLNAGVFEREDPNEDEEV